MKYCLKQGSYCLNSVKTTKWTFETNYQGKRHKEKIESMLSGLQNYDEESARSGQRKLGASSEGGSIEQYGNTTTNLRPRQCNIEHWRRGGQALLINLENNKILNLNSKVD